MLRRCLGIVFARHVAAAAPLVRIQGFVGQGVHDCPGNVGVAGGLGARSAVGDLAAAGGTALDGQEGLGDVRPPGIPLDTAALDRVLGLENQHVLGFKAVVNRRNPWVEIAHQVEHAVTDAGDIDADMLHVEALGKFLDFPGLKLERLPPPTVLLQDAEFGPGLQRRGNDHTGGVVAGSTWVVANPYRAVAEGAILVGLVVFPQRQVGIATLQVFEAERALRAVDELAIEQLLELVFVVLQLQLLKVEQITAAVDSILNGDGLAPLAVRAQRALGVGRFGRPGPAGLFPALAVAELVA